MSASEAKQGERWTPEPWKAERERSGFINDSRGGWLADTTTDRPEAEDRANRDRIVACVNALAGVADPAQFVKSHASLLAACKWALDLIDMYDGFLVSLGEPKEKVYSDVHVDGVAKARAAIALASSPTGGA